MLLLVIVLLNGSEAHLNPREISVLIDARNADDPLKKYADEVRCIVQMTSGHEYTTKEECSSIEKRLNEIRKKLRP